ncbi:MAG: hypothetical protein HY928_14905 [Elusimicrobia bacterium]|nr:hypothetical protein [Elusimicrobiota bacterium]
MTKNPTPVAKAPAEPIVKDRPAASLLRSWGKRMSAGSVAPIPVFIGGTWSLAVPRGNKRILQLPIEMNRG